MLTYLLVPLVYVLLYQGFQRQGPLTICGPPVHISHPLTKFFVTPNCDPAKFRRFCFEIQRNNNNNNSNNKDVAI